MGLSFLWPAALLLATTTFATKTLATIPLLWVLQLALWFCGPGIGLCYNTPTASPPISVILRFDSIGIGSPA